MKQLLFCSILITGSIIVHAQQMLDSTRILFPEGLAIYCDLVPANATRCTPTRDEISAAEIAVSNYMAASNDPQYAELKTGMYYRQYAGFIVGGKKVVFINASCHKTGYFEKNTQYPKGGGACYYRALVDLNEKKIVTLLVNAPK